MIRSAATGNDTATPRRAGRVAITVAVLAALLAPVVFDHDDHPLSTYPMYASTRSNVVTFATAQMVDESGRRTPLSLETIGASDDPLIVAGELRAAIANGDVDRRCREIAKRLVRITATPGAVEVVTEHHDTIAASADEPSLLERRVHGRCEVAP